MKHSLISEYTEFKDEGTINSVLSKGKGHRPANVRETVILSAMKLEAVYRGTGLTSQSKEGHLDVNPQIQRKVLFLIHVPSSTFMFTAPSSSCNKTATSG